MTGVATDRREAIRALATLADTPSDTVAEALGLGPIDPADHTEVFALLAPPYASVYLDPTGMLGGEVAARIGGFWQALGYPVPDQPDHLSALLGLYVGLGEREEHTDGPRRAMLAQARHALLAEHLVPWLGVYLDVVEGLRIAPWEQWARLLRTVVSLEGSADDVALSRHLAAAPPPIDDWRDVRALLTPVRSGIVMTRADLAHCARHSGLGVRLTGRTPTLRALLDQSPDTVSIWLSTHAAAWEERHRARGVGGVASFWAGRAAVLRGLLDDRGEG